MKRLRKIKARHLATHLIITLLYPVFKAVTAPSRKLMVFTDALTIIALVMVIGGVIYSLVLRGDFDIAGFALIRGARRENKQSFETYMADRKEKREEAFNYPLFLGIVYLAVSLVIAYGFL